MYVWLVKYVILCLTAVVFSFLIHEFSHWAFGEFLGNDMVMTLNFAYPKAGTFLLDWHHHAISAIGPLITMLQSVVFFLLIKRYANQKLFPFLFTPFYLEVLSGIMNYRNPNDLGRISEYLNLGLYTLSVIFVALHFALVFQTVRREKYERRLLVSTLLLVLLFSSAWILSNKALRIVLIP